MIEVQLRPGTPGCLRWPLNLLTLGLLPLLTRWAERRFIRRLDAQGFETRGGRRVAWQEVTRARRVATTLASPGHVSGGAVSNELVLESRRGRASLPLWRAVNADEALAFTLAHLPHEAQAPA